MKSYYRFLRRAVQLASLALFIWLLAQAVWPQAELSALPVSIFLRTDPLLALAVPLAAREFVSALIPGLIVIASALVLGRFFCGWLCPMGATLDIISFLLGRKNSPGPKSWPAQIKFALLAAVLAAAAVGAAYAFWASPISLITRFYALLLHPALLWSGEAALTHLPPSISFLEQYQHISIEPRFYEGWPFLLGFFALLFWLERRSPRFWCRNLCPAGAILAIASRLPLWRRRVRQCTSCGRCSRVCPARAISGKGRSTSFGDCLTCLRCVDACPARGILFRPSPTPLPLKILESPPGRLNLSRRAFLGGAVMGLGSGWMHTKGLAQLEHPKAKSLAAALAGQNVVRPPGARPENDFLALCARCGECMKVCPTGGLQPVWPGPVGLFSPRLSARKGPCEPECNACGQVCPTAAITKLPMPEKRWAKMGTAVVRPEICLAWAEQRSCVVCQEVCPYGAIELEVADSSRGVPTPVVRTDYCYGCGYCEFHCPVTTAEAAIVVESQGALRLPGHNYQGEGKAHGLSLDPLTRTPAETPGGDQLPPGFLE